jgi:hypothetical protein
MTSEPGPSRPADTARRAGLEAAVHGFESAWQRGERPDINAALAGLTGEDRAAALVELVHIDLELRLKAGEPARVEDYLRRHPELAGRTAVVRSLIDAEYRQRGRGGPDLGLEDYRVRFPELVFQLPTRPQTVPTPDAGLDGSPPRPDGAGGFDLRDHELLEQVGRGGMGEVFRGKDPALGRDLAVKVLRPNLRGDRGAERRFQREARVTGALQHPNIVPVHNLGRLPDGRLYFTMKLVRGRTLADMLAEGTGAGWLPGLLGVFEKVCQAVAFAHSRGVIHRDLKPANVMVGAFGEVQVMDWGLAKVLHSAPDVGSQAVAPGEGSDTVWRVLQTGSTVDDRKTGVVGTPAYMPPEQARGAADDIDERADVFGLGAILCEVLTGRPPYSGASVADVLGRAVGGDTGEALARLDGCGADEELVALCRECLAAERTARPRDGRAVAERVLAYQAGVQERLRTAELERASALAREQEARATATAEAKARRRTRALAAAGLVMALLGGTGAWLFNEKRLEALGQQGRAERAEALANERVEQVTQEKERANDEAAIARAVNSFLQQDLLGQADISNQPLLGGGAGRNRDITVGELLDRASRAIEGKFAAQPLTEAAIRLTLGDAYRGLGRFDEAQPHLERSVQLRSAQLGPEHLDTLSSKSCLALVYQEQARYKRARPLFQEILAASTARLGAAHPDTLKSKNNLAELYRILGQYDRAEPLYKEVLDVRSAQLGPDHLDTLSSKHDLAFLYKLQGKHGLAEPLYKEVLDARTAQLGPDHPDTLSCKHNLAALYSAQAKYALAESLYKEVLDVRLVKLGPDHPHTLITKNGLAFLYQNQGMYERAESLGQEVLATSARKLGPDHPDTLRAKQNLAVLYNLQKKYDRAEALFKEVLAGHTANFGPDHPDTLGTKFSLAGLYNNQGKYERSEPLLLEVVDTCAAKLGPDHTLTLTSKNNLALMYYARGKYDLAEPLYKEVLGTSAAQLGAHHPDTLRTKHNLATLYHARENYERAETLMQEALIGYTAQFDGNHPSTLNCKNGLAVVYQAQGKFELAEPLYKDVLTAYTAQFGAENLNTLLCKNNLAVLYGAQKKYDLAEPLLREVFAGYAAQLEPDHPNNLLCKSNLARVYHDQGKYDLAEPLHQEAVEGARKKLRITHPWTQRFIRGLIACREKMGQPARAEALLRELIDAAEQQGGKDSAQYAGQLAALGSNLLLQKRADDAEAVLRTSLTIRRQKEADAWTTFESQSLLGGALLQRQKYADAEPLLQQGYEGMKQREATIPHQSKDRLGEAVARLVQLYEAWGNKEKADLWREKRLAAPPPQPAARP